MNPEVTTGLFTLGGVLLGGLLTPLTNYLLDMGRERKSTNRAKLLVAAELQQSQGVLLAVSNSKSWAFGEEAVDSLLPTSAWRENRTNLVGKINEDLWERLVLDYTLLETDRARFTSWSRSPTPYRIPEKEAKALNEFATELGRRRRQLGSGGWFKKEAKEHLIETLEMKRVQLNAKIKDRPGSDKLKGMINSNLDKIKEDINSKYDSA
jgi:hypothetical protein